VTHSRAALWRTCTTVPESSIAAGAWPPTAPRVGTGGFNLDANMFLVERSNTSGRGDAARAITTWDYEPFALPDIHPISLPTVTRWTGRFYAIVARSDRRSERTGQTRDGPDRLELRTTKDLGAHTHVAAPP